MKLVVTAFFMAWGMFWMVPCPLKWWDERARKGMLLFLPVIGLLNGLVWALFVWLREKYLPGLLGAGLLTVIPYVFSGFIHLDGYMDCADAVLSRRDLETRRKILKDSHVGSFAVVALAIPFIWRSGFWWNTPYLRDTRWGKSCGCCRWYVPFLALTPFSECSP